MIDCYFGTNEYETKCSSKDFENFHMNDLRQGHYYNCYNFNGGKNATEHEIPLLRSSIFRRLH